MKQFKYHLSNTYASLRYYVGEELELLQGLDVAAEPHSIRLIDDFPNTILIEMEFLGDIWHSAQLKPRYIRQMIPKASLIIGEVKLRTTIGRNPLWGACISGRVSDKKARIKE